MSDDIYSDIRGEALKEELGGIRVYIYDINGDRYKPNLIIPNMLAVVNMRNYLNKVIDKYGKKYFKERFELVRGKKR